MLFKPEHVAMIIAGDKTQTRRVCKPGEELIPDYLFPGGGYAPAVLTPSGRIKWQVGNTYAVQPGRGKPGVWWNKLLDGTLEWQETRPGEYNNWQPLRIRILEIRRELLQAISEADAVAEGCESDVDMEPRYDGPPEVISYSTARDEYQALWDTINTRPGTRWQDAPDCWALTFEVVK